MKHKKMIMLFIAAMCVQNSIWAQVERIIGGIKYSLSGVSATVIQYLDNDGNSRYTRESYTIPSTITYNNTLFTVCKIGDNAFWGNSKISTIILPNTVKEVGEQAFYRCNNLVSIDLGGTEIIGKLAFYWCNSLTSVTLPNCLTSIGFGAFNICGLTSVLIPNSVTTIGEDAFRSCPALKKIIINDVGVWCKINFGDWSLPNGYHLYYENGDEITNLIIPNNIKEIGNFTFKGCIGLKSVTIPNSVTSIGSSAFSGCIGLTNVIIGNNVKKIEQGAFTGCTGLTSVIIPNSVTSIGNEAFGACSGLTSIEIPNSVTTIGSAAFTGCTGITSIKIPNSVTTIEEYAFAHCIGIEKLEIPNSVTSIGNGAFIGCTKIGRIIIPENVTTMGDANMESPFHGCNLLRELFYLSPTPPQNWVATTYTYVPDKLSYSSPSESINNAQIIEMITFDENEFEYIGQAPTTTWKNNVEGYSAFLTMPTLNANVGEHQDVIPVTFTKDNESFTANVVYRYTIKPAKLTAKINNVSREYGEENPQFNVTYSGFLNGENESVITSVPTISTTALKTSDVGNYPLTISGGSATNYEFLYEPGTLTINKAPLTAKVDDVSKQYGAGNPAFTISYNGLKNAESVPKWSSPLLFNTSATNQSDVGSYTITATGVPVNYNLETIESGTLSITPSPMIIRANDSSRMYYELDPSFTFTCFGFVNNDDEQALSKTPKLTTTATRTSNVGNYDIVASGAESKNYAISYEKGTLSITKRPLTVTSHVTRMYGEENPLLPIEYTGFVNNETEGVIAVKPTVTTTATTTSPVGEYPITLSGGESTNYKFVYEPGVLTVTKASLSAKVKDATKVYGTQNPSFEIEYYGLKNGEAVPAWTSRPTFQTEATKASGVGQYPVKAVDGISANYDLQIADGTLSITPAQLTLKANDAVRQYYSEEPAFSYRCDGFVNNDDESTLTAKPILTTMASLTSNVGTYEIKADGASSSNYSISYVNGTLTITPRTLYASVGNYERLYNEENPAFEVKYEGFVGNEDESVLSSPASASTKATKISDVGTYSINVTGGSAENYDFSYISGILTINKAEQTLSWDQDLIGLGVGDQIELMAESTSGLPITYTMDSNNKAEIYSAGTKSFLDCKAEGDFQIVAVQEGNKNYYSSSRIRKRVVIGDASAINFTSVSSANVQAMPFGIRITGINNGELIRVYTVDGVLQTTVSATGDITDIHLIQGNIYIVRIGSIIVKVAH